MKKVISLISLILALSILLCSCTTQKAKSVIIDDKEYRTIYLYSFKDAEIDGGYINYLHKDAEPTDSGYAYSYRELFPGDSIRVWINFYFGVDDSETSLISDWGTNAIVDAHIKTYQIEVKKNRSTYNIKYYTIKNEYDTATEIEDLSPIEVEEIEIVHERVVVKYS